MAGRRSPRSASYYESGTGRGMGFRDSNQDLLGFVHLIPERARERIINIASTQLPDGSAWHQYQPLTKRGNADIGGGFNDDPLWLVASVFAYLSETGDAGMFVLYGRQYAEILERFGADCGMSADAAAAEAAAVREAVAQVEQATETAGWDGEWFLRAYDAYSRPVGSHTDTEGQIYIEPQGMCVMAGIGLENGKAQQALKSVRDRLTCDWGTAIEGNVVPLPTGDVTAVSVEATF